MHTRSPPRPRKAAHDLYWYFASERQAIFERRVAGLSAPWTTDPILREYKFCNVYRAADRVSQFLIQEIAVGAGARVARDIIFQVVAFRLFSKIETWATITDVLGTPPTIDSLATGRFEAALEHALSRLGGLYTGAFILCAADAYGRGRKHKNHASLLHHMFVADNLAERIESARSLGDVFHALKAYPLIGDFMAYQIAIDLNYTSVLAFSENEFTAPGPGALRGIRKVFETQGEYSAPDLIRWMVERQEDEFRSRGLPFRGLWGRPLHAIDCQGLFCEVDKYCRVALPELTSARTRIKTRFRPSGAPLRLLFPSRWGINALLPQETVAGPTSGAR